jgi:capsular polysaccharide biosynthesis protein
MSAKKSLPIDPKDLLPAAVGFVLGLGILVFFVLLAKSMDLTLLVNHHDIPHQ